MQIVTTTSESDAISDDEGGASRKNTRDLDLDDLEDILENGEASELQLPCFLC